ncbi:MAG: nucleotidyltransferase, partial [Propionivibrio sp.]
MSNEATQMLVAATIEFLRAFPPFDRMELESLEFLGHQVKLAYYPKETIIASPETGPVLVYRILQRGKVTVRHTRQMPAQENLA